MLEFPSVNVGNFLELIHFQVAAGDEIKKKDILKAPSNAKYMSKTIQNELICLCVEEIVTGIISEVNEEFFLFWQKNSDIVPILNKLHLFSIY